MKNTYDYLVVGSGLYGAILAHEAKAHGKSVLVVDKRPNIAGTSTPRISRASMFISMVLIFFIPTIRRSGITLPGSQNLTDLLIHLWPTIRVNSTRYLSICILLTRCGVL